MGSDDEETKNSDFESDEDSGEGAEQNVNRFENHTDSNLHVWKLIETNEDEIAIEQGKRIFWQLKRISLQKISILFGFY